MKDKLIAFDDTELSDWLIDLRGRVGKLPLCVCGGCCDGNNDRAQLCLIS